MISIKINNRKINVTNLTVKQFNELIELNKGKLIEFKRVVK